MNVSASLVCDNNTAAVSWSSSPGAAWYNVTATSGGGDIRRCSTNGTSCHLPNMHCSETYAISVTPYSARCQGPDSAPYSLTAGEPHLDVHIRDATVKWNPPF